MKYYKILLNLIMLGALMISCEETGDAVIGSKDHELQAIKSSEPELIANGISTARITATVFDKDGNSAYGMKVAFETSHGTIEKSDYTAVNGEASVILTSEPSTTDLIAEITATVVDTAFKSLGKSSPEHYYVKLDAPDFECEANDDQKLDKTNQQLGSSAKIIFKFIGVTMNAEITDSHLPADGLAKTKLTIRVRETTSQKGISFAEVYLGAKLGKIEGSAFTNTDGRSEVFLTAGERAGIDTIYIDYGNKLSTYLTITYINPQFSVKAKSAQAPADGESTIEIVATLLTTKNNPIVGATVRFSTSKGTIQEFANTNTNGQAIVNLIATDEPDSAVEVIADFLSLSDTVTVAFVGTFHNTPNSIILEADPNYIWVKETGNLEQTKIIATIIGVTGREVGNDFGVKFFIVNSPGGGELIQPSDGMAFESSVIPTVNGKAEAYIRSGIRSGTVQIRAELVDYPTVAAQTTNITIRSGPPYMWVDETDVNNVIPHATLIVQTGKHNTCFGNPVQDIRVTAIFGDKYNNPAEQGTAVYFTTSGGIITSDAVTNEKGQAGVILQNCYPFPYLTTEDVNQLTSCCIPNPNNENVYLNTLIPDFEGGEILNSLGDTNQNDGGAVLLAYTWGNDQNGNLIKVWATNMVIFSSGVNTFTATADKRELRIGEATNIYIRLFDIHGNPMAAGSKLTAATTDGELSEKNLMASVESYGYGTTFFSTQLINSLDPVEDEPTDAVVTFDLDSPNGSGKIAVSVYLRID